MHVGHVLFPFFSAVSAVAIAWLRAASVSSGFSFISSILSVGFLFHLVGSLSRCMCYRSDFN